MREILFRGIDEGTKEWVYGYYYESQKPSDFGGERRYYIFDDKTISKYNVLPETIGQYTGLTDKNGKKIFEGDIIEFEDMLGIINFNFGCYCVKTNKPDWKARNNPAIDIIFNEYPNAIKIIGNIHDNPELLKGGE